MDNDEERIRKYRDYQDKLLKIKGNNRCIRLRKITKKHTFDLSTLSELEHNPIDSLIENAIEHKSVCILRDSDKSDEAITARSHLTQIYRNIRQSENETGSQFGYVGFPFLEGQVGKKYFIRSPLALFPVSLEYKRASRPAGWYLVFSKNHVRLNNLLFVALTKIANHSFENLDSEFDERFYTFTGPDFVQEIIEKFKNLLEHFQVPISKNQTPEDSILMKLDDMPSSETDELDNLPLSIKNYKILGSFPQLNSGIHENYNELIKLAQQGEKDELIDKLLKISSDKNIDVDTTEIEDEELDNVSDDEINLILPSDASQDQIILASQKNKITLVRGPPGTGKSQVIANLISNSLMKGERVLVVCDKKSALQVVFDRLSEENKVSGNNLAEHVVLLDKEKDDRSTMYTQLKRILEFPPQTDLVFEQHLFTKSRQIDELIKKHSEIAIALKTPYNGTTIKSLYTQAVPHYSRILSLKGLEDGFNFLELDYLLRNIEKIEKNYRKFENPNFSWSIRNDFSKLRSLDKDSIKQILDNIRENIADCILLQDSSQQNELDSLAEEYLEKKQKYEKNQKEIESTITELEQIFLKNNKTFNQDEKNYQNNLQGGLALWEAFGSLEKIKSLQNNSILEDSPQKQSELINAISHTRQNSGFLKKFIDSETRQNKKKTEDFLVKHKIDKASALEKLQNGLELWGSIKSWDLKDSILNNPLIFSSLLEQNNAISCLNLQKSLEISNSELQEFLNKVESDIVSLLKSNSIKIDSLDSEFSLKIKNGGIVISNLLKLSEFLSEFGFNHLKELKNNDPDKLQNIISQMLSDLEDFDSLVSFDINKSKMSSFEEIILKSCIENALDKDNWKDIIKQEIIYYFIEYIESLQSVLRGDPFVDYEYDSNVLRTLLDEKRNLVASNIAIKIEKNSKTNRGSQKTSLIHELGKKKKVIPIRQLLDEYGDEIFNIIPCWLASPDMVSNIFPLKKNLFDLIIVDEASQLAQERAIPFLYRGDRIVVAGDEKQLKPYDLFESKEDDSITEDDDEIESLLILVKATVESKMLSWHYRSAWQELIDFSNHAFYEGQLQVSPNVKKTPPEPPIRWISVENGIWEDRSNKKEAEKVVDTIHSVLLEYNAKSEHPSIGVITFNSEQKDTIYNTIDNRKREDPEFADLYSKVEFPVNDSDVEIFIRNIENVQGDERKIILFSIGYGLDQNNVFRKNFGTLSKAGGENRLNVAITRASQRIYVVCSFDPETLVVEGLKNPGPKFLKQFLEYSKAVSDQNNEKKEGILKQINSGMNVSKSTDGGYSDSVFEDMVCEKLVALGYNVKQNVGFSGYRIDLAIEDPTDSSKYILGVECDGATFHQAESVRERDVSRQKFLERQGWNIARIWSRNYWRNPQKEINRIDEKIKEISGENEMECKNCKMVIKLEDQTDGYCCVECKDAMS